MREDDQALIEKLRARPDRRSRATATNCPLRDALALPFRAQQNRRARFAR